MRILTFTQTDKDGGKHKKYVNAEAITDWDNGEAVIAHSDDSAKCRIHIMGGGSIVVDETIQQVNAIIQGEAPVESKQKPANNNDD